MEALLGRYLTPIEHVHHRDGNKANNDPANLELLGGYLHRRLHGRQLPRVAACEHCGCQFPVRWNYGKLGPGSVSPSRFCSNRCSLLSRWQAARVAGLRVL